MLSNQIPPNLSEKVFVALKAAFSELQHAAPDQHFYTFALFSDDSLQFLHPVANSEEALIATVEHYKNSFDLDYGGTSTLNNMRWSYGDWGFFPDVGGPHFIEINQMLQAHFHGPEAGFEARLEELWESILTGFLQMEAEQFFGVGAARSKITLLLVGDLPEALVDRAVTLLNPQDVIDRYLNWDPTAPDPA